MLKEELPSSDRLHYLQFPSFKPYYFSANLLLLGLFLQLPMFFFYYFKERRFVKRLCKKKTVDIIISDNRYGFFSRKVASYIVCHQLQPALGGGVLSKVANHVHVQLLNHFSACIVPDSKPFPNVSGALSASDKINKTIHIGPVSRFVQYQSPQKKATRSVGKPIRLLILLSGPEPQRTRWGRRLMKQLLKENIAATIVGGQNTFVGNSNCAEIQCISAAFGEDLKRLILDSENIICRAGYTTIMELLSLHKSAVLVPTPGQTEQEYLAAHLAEKGWFIRATEKECLSRIKDLDTVSFPGNISFNKFSELSQIVC